MVSTEVHTEYLNIDHEKVDLKSLLWGTRVVEQHDTKTALSLHLANQPVDKRRCIVGGFVCVPRRFRFFFFC